jgi:uncharacterized membrane protein
MTAGVHYSELNTAAGFSRVVRRNNSLTSTGRLLVFAFIFAVSIGIATGFALLGAWLVLPFAGLEMVVLWLAFRYVDRRAGDFERIAIAGDRVQIEVCEAGRRESHELNRCWARLVDGGGRLALRSHGREYEIGRYLDDEQRLALRHEIGRQLGGR